MKDKDLMEAILAAAILGGAQKKKDTTKPEKETNHREKAAELAKPLYEAYLGFMDAGFTSEQAFQLLLKTSN